MEITSQLQSLLNDPSSTTPMMQQYAATKKEHIDAILFYRMGDFYEMFLDDAVAAAEILDIALTHRGKHDDDDIAMCGVPHHSYEPYLQKLIRAGRKVAICEQMESPEEAKKRGYKAVVRREVVRVVTPGTLFEEHLLEAKESNYLVAVATAAKEVALAWADISTGEFHTASCSKEGLASELARLMPKEILVAEKVFYHDDFHGAFTDFRARVNPQANSQFDYAKAEKKCHDFYGVNVVESFGDFSRSQMIACGALLEYITLTQCGAKPNLAPPKIFQTSHFMEIDLATRKSLELVKTAENKRQGSVLHTIDETKTSGGARLLAQLLASPLTDVTMINKRLDMVECFATQEALRSAVRELLSHVPDMERALSRIAVAKAGPRDLALLRDGLHYSLQLKEMLLPHGAALPKPLVTALEAMQGYEPIAQELAAALIAEPGMLARDGGFIAAGYHKELDELRDIRDNAKEKIQNLRDHYRDKTTISNLKISHNNVLGYFVEISPAHQGKMTDEIFIHRQSLASSMRYTTEELRQLESDILGAKTKAVALEVAFFNRLCETITEQADKIGLVAYHMSMIDVVSALAELAVSYGYVRPSIDNSLSFDIRGGRHLVVEKALAKPEDFIKNDANFAPDQRLWLLTGPNMAGKSTFLRQNALIAILAQMGSFVPADSAYIGVVDKVFSRVGASDDLASGRSTFMVEMIETATIVNQATPKSLVILDEIGRGTATYDGLSIAWAVVEQLHEKNQCRGLFATHYHELTALVDRLSHLACYSMKVQEWKEEIIFMHEVVPGAADRSYGIHVAKLAGLPKQLLARAEQVLASLQEQKQQNIGMKSVQDLPLFTSTEPVVSNTANDNVVEKLLDKNIDELSPKEALDFLYQLKQELS